MRTMTLAQARAEGLLDGKAKTTRTTRKTEPRAGARSHCLTHDEWFTTDAAENQHVDTVGGAHRIEFPDV